MTGDTRRPNLLVFVADTFRAWGLRHLGNPAAVTPNPDRMASEEGVWRSEQWKRGLA